MKSKITKKHLRSLLVTIISCSVVYVAFSVYTGVIGARQTVLFDYLQNRFGRTETTPTYLTPACPKFIKVEGVTGGIIVKDECTDIYWHRMDLPLFNSAAATVPVGYTYDEAKNYCEKLATTPEGRPIFRLPTADELLSAVYTPCPTPGNCSPFINPDEKFSGENLNIMPVTGKGDAQTKKMFFEFENNKFFADGAYWAADEIDAVETKETYEAASSVNLRYGTVNNPLFGKGVKLNVRCIYNKPLANEFPGDPTKVQFTDYPINDVQWWTKDDTANCSAQGSNNGTDRNLIMKASVAYRRNLLPNNLDVNNCPAGVDNKLTGEYNLCTGITSLTSQCVIFGCPSGKSYIRTGDVNNPRVECR